MKRKISYRIISAMLVMTITTCSLSDYVSAGASSSGKITNETTEKEVTVKEATAEVDNNDETDTSSKEDTVIEKTTDSTTFEGENGEKELVLHGYNVRYENENGELVDYNPSLVKIKDKNTGTGTSLKGYTYENKEGDNKQYIPEILTKDTPILMENQDYQISFRPVFDNEEMLIQLEESTAALIEIKALDDSIFDNDEEKIVTINADTIEQEDLSKVELSEETVENIYEEEVDIRNTATYSLKNKTTDLQYVSLVFRYN